MQTTNLQPLTSAVTMTFGFISVRIQQVLMQSLLSTSVVTIKRQAVQLTLIKCKQQLTMYLPTTHLHHRRQNLQFRKVSFGLRQVITLTSAFIHGMIHHQQSMKSPTQQQTASISSGSHSLQAIQTLSSVGGRM